MRLLDQRPSDGDFVPARDYEAEAPAQYSLPEVGVLYCSLRVHSSAHVWLTSEGLYLSDDHPQCRVYDLDEVVVVPESLVLSDCSLPLDAEQSHQLSLALHRCQLVFGHASLDEVDLAEAADYETGDADDLGAPELVTSYGQGLTRAEGPNTATKRRRSE